MAGEPRVQWIAEQMQSIQIAEPPSQPPKLKQGQLCLAVFSEDKQLYRYKIALCSCQYTFLWMSAVLAISS